MPKVRETEGWWLLNRPIFLEFDQIEKVEEKEITTGDKKLDKESCAKITLKGGGHFSIIANSWDEVDDIVKDFRKYKMKVNRE